MTTSRSTSLLPDQSQRILKGSCFESLETGSGFSQLQSRRQGGPGGDMSRTGHTADGNEADGFEAFPNPPRMICNVM
jgi:hypothetical protein